MKLGASVSAGIAMASCAVARSCAGGIFTDTARTGSVDPSASRAVRRLRRVEVDFDRIVPGGPGSPAARAAGQLTLNLFPDVCVVAVRERASDLAGGRVQWEGRVPGASPGTATLVVGDKVVVGTVRVDREVYEIRYLGDGVHAVLHVDQSKFPPD